MVDLSPFSVAWSRAESNERSGGKQPEIIRRSAGCQGSVRWMFFGHRLNSKATAITISPTTKISSNVFEIGFGHIFESDPGKPFAYFEDFRPLVRNPKVTGVTCICLAQGFIQLNSCRDDGSAAREMFAKIFSRYGFESTKVGIRYGVANAKERFQETH